MAWDDIGEGRYGGDAPLDAYGAAVAAAAKRFDRAIGRKPLLAEIVAALDGTIPAGSSASFDALARATGGEAPTARARRRLETGELVSIPYAAGRAVVGLVLLGAEKKIGHHGPCVVALDLEASELGELDRARTTRWLIRPFHPGSREAFDPLARVVLTPDPSVLPCFGWWERPGSRGLSAARFEGARRVIVDSFDRRVEVTPAHEARVVPSSIGGGFVAGIRAARGLTRERPWDRYARSPDAEPTPLAHLPPFVAPKPKRPRKAKRVDGPDASLRESLVTLFEAAARDCHDEWRDRWDRPADREELAHALTMVLRGAPDDYLADPGRIEGIPRPPRLPTAREPVGARTLTWREREGVEYVVVKEPDGTAWSAFPAREDGAIVVDVSGGEDGVVDEVLVREVLPSWRDRGRPVAEGEVVTVRGIEWGEPRRLRT